MKKFFVLICLCLMLISCGSGGGNGGTKDGTMSFAITDSKPVLPENVTNCFITIDEVLVHKSGNNAEWFSLPLKETPFTVDLLEYTNGETAELIPPVKLEPAQYTQLRLSVKDAFLRVTNPDNTTEDFPLEIPSGVLKTDAPFEVLLGNKGFIDMVIDFDLSQSIVVTGKQKYKLKPVLHLVKVQDAVILEGSILNTLFVEGETPIVTVYQGDGTIFTQVAVEKEVAPATDSLWEVFWVVPSQNYKVEIDYDPSLNNGPEFIKDVLADSIPPGTTLNIE